MSALATRSAHSQSSGLMRSAALMRALGAQATSVWSTLNPQEAQQLTSAMEALPDDYQIEQEAAQAYVRDMSQPGKTDLPQAGNFWQVLSQRDGNALASLIQKESPQVIAVILSQLAPDSAAATVRALPRAFATEILHRLLHLGDVQPKALQAIEDTLKSRLLSTAENIPRTGHERLAAIFDRLDSKAEQGLLSSLDQTEPGTRDRVRALMFTFDDLASLGPASLQTILAATDRAVLIVALKGASPETASAFFDNMTSRAADLLKGEIEAAGPVRRSGIEAARNEITALARSLVKRGDILSSDANDDELVE